MKKYSAFWAFCLCISTTIAAQNKAIPVLSQTLPGQFLVQLYPPYTTAQAALTQTMEKGTVVSWQPLAPQLGLYQLMIQSKQPDAVLLATLQGSKWVKTAQYNHLVERRNTVPNDPLFANQWHHAKIQAAKIWSETTGGQTSCGDSVVVAVLDFGFNVQHPDLKANIWQNKAEIPNNGLDDDNNGYTDDRFGLNARDNSGQHLVDSLNNGVLDPHGTLCAGLIGGVGNNGIGGTGLLWQTQLMIVSGTFSEAEVVKGYMYAHDMRKKYNESQGQLGAFVAVTSLSVGLSGGSVAQNRLWCEVYDLLGQQGILNIVAAANTDNTVEAIGDIPALCPSPYLMVVTRTDNADKRSTTAAYSTTHVDLAAPGVDLLTTTPDGRYGEESGNSFAAPLVAGAAALLYTLPNLDTLCHLSPAQQSLRIKQALLEGTDPLSILTNKTVSGGRLNVWQASLRLRRQFGMPVGKPAILAASPNPAQTQVVLRLQAPVAANMTLVVANTLGQVVLTQEITPSDLNQSQWPINIENLSNGVYFITLKTTTFEAATKVVVQH